MVLIANGSAEAQRRSGQPAFVGCICGLGRRAPKATVIQNTVERALKADTVIVDRNPILAALLAELHTSESWPIA